MAYCSQYILDDALGYDKTKRLHPNYDGNTKFAMLFVEDEITFNILQRMGQEYNLLWAAGYHFMQHSRPQLLVLIATYDFRGRL